MTDSAGALLRPVAADAREVSAIGRYLKWLDTERGLTFDSYDELQQWSVSDLEGFWRSLWDHYGVVSDAPISAVLPDAVMPGARWFVGAEVNYARHLLVDADRGGVAAGDSSELFALIAYSQTRDRVDLTFDQLRDQVARARAGLVRLGVRRGDRVVAYLPNIPETVVVMLAAASLGAVFASCAPEFGPRSVVDRFAQIEPTVLLAVAGYTYGDKVIDRRDEVAEIRAALPTISVMVVRP